MKLILDTSIWIEHLRHAALTPLFPIMRGKVQLLLDGVAAGELWAGCRSKPEREAIEQLVAPFRRAGRLLSADSAAFERAGKALSRLREKGKTLRRSAGALLDATTAATAAGIGATVVSLNASDFEALATVLPFRFEAFDSFRIRMLEDR